MVDNTDGLDLSGLDTTGLTDIKNQNNQGNNNNEAQKAADEAKKIADEKAANDIKIKTEEAEKLRLAEEEKKKQNQGGQNNDTTPEAVEIDGIKYKLDKDGNALDDKGTIFKSKADLDALEAGQDIPLVNEIIKNSGYEPLDDKGKPKLYEDSVEGILQANKDIADLIAKKNYENLVNADPDVKALHEFKQRGGKTEEFFQRKANSWQNVKLDVSNAEQLEKVVMADLLASGMPEEQAKLTTSMYKDTKKLEEFGKLAYDRLTTHEKNVEKYEKQQFELHKQQEEQRINKHWETVNDVIKKGNLNNITIPDNDRDAFYNYIAMSADENGNSQSVLDKSKLPMEQLLQLEYLQFKKFDLSKLIANAVKSANVRSLKSRIGSTQQSVGGGQGIDKDKYTKSDDSAININNMM